MATYTLEAENNQEDAYYTRKAESIKTIGVVLQEGDFIVLKRPAYSSNNYVYHKGKIRFIGNY